MLRIGNNLLNENILGAELVLNGTFDANVDDWSSLNSAILTWDAGEINVENGAAEGGIAYQLVSVENGKTYWYSGFHNGFLGRFSIGSSEGGVQFVDEANIADQETRTGCWTSVGTNAYINLWTNSGTLGSSRNYDNISIKQMNIVWVPYGSNILEIENNYVKITYDDEADGAYLELKGLVVGNVYSIKFEAKGEGVKVKTASETTSELTASWAEYEIVHTALTTDSDKLEFDSMGGGEIGYIRNIVIKKTVTPGMSLIRKDSSEDYLVNGEFDMVRLPWSEDYNLLTRQPFSEIYEDEDGEIYTRLDYSEDFQTETLKFVRQPNSEDYLVEAR